MKRIYALMAAFSFVLPRICAQQPAHTFSITPKAGVTVSDFAGKMRMDVYYSFQDIPPADKVVDNSDYMPKKGIIESWDTEQRYGFSAGVEGLYQFTSAFGLSFGLLYTQEGADYKKNPNYPFTYEETTYDFNSLKLCIDCITIPVLANMYIWKDLALKAGLQPEFAVRRKTEYDLSITYKGKKPLMMNHPETHVTTFTLSLPVGVSYEYRNVVADLRYSIGLTNLRDKWKFFKGDESGFPRNRTLSFILGYKFQL